MKKIGLTTTVPIEILIAAGYTPVDLNNIFIASDNYMKYIDIAEKDGFPKNMCAWIKGIYGACIDNDIKEVVGVVEGDCSNTKVLVDVFKLRGIKAYPFSFPHRHTMEEVKNEINEFMKLFDVKYDDAERVRERLNMIRELAKEIDRLTYDESVISGFENHLYQLCLSDFNGDIGKYESDMKDLIKTASKREPIKKKLKLGYIGVPPMMSDIYEYVENFDARFVYNEVQREFAFPRADKAVDIYGQYYDYTYPYNLDFRIKELQKQINKRELDGIIHYTQAFCYRATEYIILKEKLNIPILNIEGDKLNVLDARTKLRIEAFLDMLVDLKETSK